MNILGLGGSNHDLSACLVRDGKLISYIEEERLNRKKHSLDLNLGAARCSAADYVCQDSGIGLDEVHSVVGNDILNPLYYSRFKDCDATLNHHLCHAASALFTSGFSEAAVLVVDGYGSPLPSENDHAETITLYHAKDGEFRQLKKFGGLFERGSSEPMFENSIGGLYLCVTRAIGFSFLQEGKTMGLSAYGTAKFTKSLEQYFEFSPESGLQFSAADASRMTDFIQNTINEDQSPEAQFQAKADFAHAVQHHTETIMIGLSNWLFEATKSPNICIAGGVALNSVANWKIETDTEFSQIYIPPFCGDAGTAVGAAMLADVKAATAANEKIGQSGRPMSPYCGRMYPQDDIDAAVSSVADRTRMERPDDLPKYVAEQLNQSKIIGFWQGRSEAGPRALGHRSILADPRQADMKDTINARIKHREAFRPFAPVVLEDHQSDFFECETLVPYMLKIAAVREDKQSIVPAITHADGTARLQTVSPDMAPELAEVLSEFLEITGVPVLLNTSFNDNGEPIIETPKDAVDCFLKIDLDMLVLGPYCLFKST